MLKQQAQAAGGEAPAPAAPNPPVLTALHGLTGNDLLYKLHDRADDLTQSLADWQSVADKIDDRASNYALAGQLLAQARELPGMDALTQTLQAIRTNRSLLDDPDPTATVLQAVSSALRGALAQAQIDHADTLAAELARLDAHPVWSALRDTDRAALLREAGAVAPTLPPAATDTELLESPKRRDLRGWRDLTDALPTRCDQALAAAIKAPNPRPDASVCRVPPSMTGLSWTTGSPRPAPRSKPHWSTGR